LGTLSDTTAAKERRKLEESALFMSVPHFPYNSFKKNFCRSFIYRFNSVRAFNPHFTDKKEDYLNRLAAKIFFYFQTQTVIIFSGLLLLNFRIFYLS
jgi:hypothetical protein